MRIRATHEQKSVILGLDGLILVISVFSLLINIYFREVCWLIINILEIDAGLRKFTAALANVIDTHYVSTEFCAMQAR